jgi:response regulator of citrate/malate metabolism
MVREDLAEEMIEQFEDVEQAIVEEGQKAERPRQAGGSKIEEAIGWLWSNRGRIFSIEEACQETEISHMTIRKAIQASPDLAVKVGRGRFQIPSEAA